MCINCVEYPGSQCAEQSRKMIMTVLCLFIGTEERKIMGQKLKKKIPWISTIQVSHADLGNKEYCMFD